MNCPLCRLHYVHKDTNQCLSIVFFFFLVPRCRLHNNKALAGVSVFIYFKMTAMQEIQVNVSILCKKPCRNIFILYAMKCLQKCFVWNSFPRVYLDIWLKCFIWKYFYLHLPLWITTHDFFGRGGRTKPAIIQYHAYNQGVKRSWHRSMSLQVHMCLLSKGPSLRTGTP